MALDPITIPQQQNSQWVMRSEVASTVREVGTELIPAVLQDFGFGAVATAMLVTIVGITAFRFFKKG